MEKRPSNFIVNLEKSVLQVPAHPEPCTAENFQLGRMWGTYTQMWETTARCEIVHWDVKEHT